MKELAIVLITKNQDWNIQRLIESVLLGTASVSSSEIVVVDSASTDKTVDLAKRYPVNILRLRPDMRLTAAAGRSMGFKYSQSRHLLFLDGDMELHPGWLERAIQVMEGDPTVAVVTGDVIDLPIPAGGRIARATTLRATAVGEAIEAPICGGAAMYRRTVMEQVGTFNPYLYADEEPELCLRIRHKGYRIIHIRRPMVNHYTEPNETLSSVISRRRRNFYLGYGQNIRYHAGTELLWQYLRERGFAFIPGFALMAGLLSLLWSLTTHQWLWFGSWCLLITVFVASDARRKHSFYRTIVSLIKRLFSIEGTVRGLLLKPLPPETYPASLDVIKRLD